MPSGSSQKKGFETRKGVALYPEAAIEAEFTVECSSATCKVITISAADFLKHYRLVLPDLRDAYEVKRKEYAARICEIKQLAAEQSVKHLKAQTLTKKQIEISEPLARVKLNYGIAMKERVHLDAKSKVLEKLAEDGSQCAQKVIEMNNLISLNSVKQTHKEMKIYKSQTFNSLRYDVENNKRNKLFKMNMTQMAELDHQVIKNSEYDEIEEALKLYENEKHQKLFHSKVHSLKQLTKRAASQSKDEANPDKRQQANQLSHSCSYILTPTQLSLPNSAAKSARAHMKDLMQAIPTAESSVQRCKVPIGSESDDLIEEEVFEDEDEIQSLTQGTTNSLSTRNAVYSKLATL